MLVGIDEVQILDPSTLHLTVIPPWEEPNPEAVVRDLSAISSGPFVQKIVEAGYGHDASDPDLAWLLGPSTPDLERLHLQAWRAIKSHDPPRRPFPHVTLARFPKGVALPPLPRVDASGIVDAVALYESLSGRRYREIGRRQLA